ncbi:MAG: hypothetical protein UY01_C0005G0021 [Candidatus Nomurabacteria bacterium GW2011_GWB1_47_6]|uniref:VanZ-like domain-containing protein n=1 Tax=Candidatus Nomurabacteria bacterium GW2011_GWB1_47_6 TaxID=1618749 RepID=A0A0G1T1X1_9BACT|nr:MAG: hypothetical protein UY01_C0005G0021 [Candidatus Nomurabacteria bacterium GW2011_GWB1_47_6]
MNRKRLTATLVLMMFAIFALSLAGERWHWDILYVLLHLSGGFWVSLFFIWFFCADGLPLFKLRSGQPGPFLTTQTLLFVLVIGVLWEIFQFLTKSRIGAEPWSAPDTISDLFINMAGCLTALFYYRKIIMLPADNNVQSN